MVEDKTNHGESRPRDNRRDLGNREKGWLFVPRYANEQDASGRYFKSRYQPGDILWVRETWARSNDNPLGVVYRADPGDDLMDPIGGKWRPSIHMPRWASRLSLEVLDVRPERLQEITEEEAVMEGIREVTMADVPRQAAMSERQDFARFWDKIDGPGSWEANPWVWRYEFRRVPDA